MYMRKPFSGLGQFDETIAAAQAVAAAQEANKPGMGTWIVVAMAIWFAWKMF